MKKRLMIIVLILINAMSCQSQTEKNMSQDTNNPLLCDPTTGVCELPGTASQTNEATMITKVKPVKIVYYTDPICSACWGIEPQLRKLKLEYGDYIEIDYRMGGLLPDWSYSGGGISKPSDVAHHWEEASLYYEMPIDGGVWFEDPLPSSYPPSIAFKAAQMQDEEKAVIFMRNLREYLLFDKKNITRWEIIRDAAVAAGLDSFRLKEDYENDAKKLFEADLQYGRKLGVRGFPTLFFSDTDHNQIVLYGFRPYEVFESAIRKAYPEAKKRQIDISSPTSLFNYYPTLTAKEYAVLSEISVSEAKSILDKLTSEEKLEKQTIKTGSLYRTK